MPRLPLIILAAVLVSRAADAQLDPVETSMVDFIDATNADAETLMIESININSGSMNFAGVRAVADHLAPHFANIGFTTRFEQGSAWGRAGHLIAEHHGAGSGPKLLLIGHLDTVFEADSPFQTFERLDADRAIGPGIADMKGGNIIILQALRALDAALLMYRLSRSAE